jgi:hypothetical protein
MVIIIGESSNDTSFRRGVVRPVGEQQSNMNLKKKNLKLQEQFLELRTNTR